MRNCQRFCPSHPVLSLAILRGPGRTRATLPTALAFPRKGGAASPQGRAVQKLSDCGFTTSGGHIHSKTERYVRKGKLITPFGGGRPFLVFCLPLPPPCLAPDEPFAHRATPLPDLATYQFLRVPHSHSD